MRVRRDLALGLTCVAIVVAVSVSTKAENLGEDGAPVRLFNGRDLSGWYTFFRRNDGADPKTDPKGVFKVEDGVIHVSGEEFGALTTEKEFENYRLVIEFKWGTKKWPPRETAVRDSGVLLHCVGPDKI